MRRKGSEVLTRMCTIAILAALGVVLMAFARFPYPLAPWLMIELSEVVVFIAYAMYGFSGASIVAILKMLLDMAIHGLTGIYGIGNITALLTSFTYIFALFFFSHVFKLFNKGLGFRILAYILIIAFVSSILTSLNALFITPTYLTGTLTTCFNSESVTAVMESFKDYSASYPAAIFIIYFPFNAIKGVLVTAIYEILFNRLIFVFMQRSPKMKKYFLGPILKEKEEKEDEEKQSEIDNTQDN